MRVHFQNHVKVWTKPTNKTPQIYDNLRPIQFKQALEDRWLCWSTTGLLNNKKSRVKAT